MYQFGSHKPVFENILQIFVPLSLRIPSVQSSLYHYESDFYADLVGSQTWI